MKVRKILSGILAAVLLSGCGMPEMSFDNADSPIFREDSGKESRESTEKNDSSKPSLPDDGKAAESKPAQGMTESGKPESGKTESTDPESTKTDSRKTEPEKIYEDPTSASALTFSRTVTAKDGKTSTELFAISTETNEISPEYEKLNKALKEIPEGEALPVRTDTNVVSLIIRGEPGSTELSSVNIDTETGDFLTISDIFSDTDKLASALKTQYGEDYPDLPALTAEELDPEQYIWTLSQDGCIFYFPDPEKKRSSTGHFCSGLPIKICSGRKGRLFRIPLPGSLKSTRIVSSIVTVTGRLTGSVFPRILWKACTKRRK